MPPEPVTGSSSPFRSKRKEQRSLKKPCCLGRKPQGNLRDRAGAVNRPRYGAGPVMLGRAAVLMAFCHGRARPGVPFLFCCGTPEAAAPRKLNELEQESGSPAWRT